MVYWHGSVSSTVNNEFVEHVYNRSRLYSLPSFTSFRCSLVRFVFYAPKYIFGDNQVHETLMFRINTSPQSRMSAKLSSQILKNVFRVLQQPSLLLFDLILDGKVLFWPLAEILAS